MMNFIENTWLFLLAILIIALIFALIGANNKHKRLIAQCIEDGRKEYECVAMLKTDTQIVPMPIIIPSGR